MEVLAHLVLDPDAEGHQEAGGGVAARTVFVLDPGEADAELEKGMEPVEGPPREVGNAHAEVRRGSHDLLVVL